jgi:hypothetical protein
VLSVLLRFTDSDYPFDIFNLFVCVSGFENMEQHAIHVTSESETKNIEQHAILVTTESKTRGFGPINV